MWSLRGYLVVIARNKAIDVLRSESSRSVREKRIAGEVGSSLAQLAEAPDAAVARNDDAARVFAAVRRLPERERRPMMVAFYGQPTYQETARILHQPGGSTKSTIRSGLRRLAAARSESTT